MDGSYYEYEEDGAYCYPGTRVLRNRLGIRDAGTLAAAERDFSSLRAAAIDKGDANIAETFDSDHLRAIHRYLFGDVYDWAGEYRTVNISKGSVFCMWPYIGEQLDALFGKLAGEGLLEGLPPEAMAARLAFYLGEINAIHPFREGNGRAQRAIVRQLAKRDGYLLSFAGVSDAEMVAASVRSFNGDNGELESLVARCLSRLP